MDRNEIILNEKVSSGLNQTHWLHSCKPLVFEPLKQNLETDILVIGGGIAGLSVAYALSKAKQKVVLIDDGYLGSGESGRTTAHITAALDDRYYYLEEIFNTEKATLAANSHTAAINWIENVVNQEKIDCDFRRVKGYLFKSETDTYENLEREYAATKRVGLNTSMLPQVPFMKMEEAKPCIEFDNQAQFHIMKYLTGLADAVIRYGGEIYTETKATDIDKNGAKANGFEIKAKHIVVATNTPVNDVVTMHTKQWAYRTYVIAAKVPRDTYPFSLWWDTGNTDTPWVSEPYHYVRLERFDDSHDLLIAGGEDHKTGQADKEDISEEERFGNLIAWTKRHFPELHGIEYHWSGQVMEPVDSLDFIGKNPGDDNIYIVTGDSGNGMTHGTIGGMLIPDIIMGKENPWQELYDPARITTSTVRDYVNEALNMVAQYGDWFSSGDVRKLSEVKKGEGAVFAEGLQKKAVYRDETGKLHVCSAVCPHLGGIVSWNAEEKTFDCPAHGSRFTCKGHVLNGPAIKNLKPIEEKEH